MESEVNRHKYHMIHIGAAVTLYILCEIEGL